MGEDCSKRGTIILKAKIISLCEYYPKISINIFMVMIILRVKITILIVKIILGLNIIICEDY